MRFKNSKNNYSNQLISNNQMKQQEDKIENQRLPKVHELNLQDWKFTHEGSEHYLSSNKNPSSVFHGKALLFQSLQSEKTCVSALLAEQYNKILEKHQISKYILPKLQIPIESESQINQLKQFLKANQRRKGNAKKLWIMENLHHKEQWDIFVEFKIKGPLPDIYSPQLIVQVCSKFGLTWEKICNILKKCEPIQKTKWYKKNFDKQKTHANPFYAFGLQQRSIDFCGTKLFKDITPDCKQNRDEINKRIHKYLADTNIIESIYDLQTLYVGPVPKPMHSPSVIQIKKGLQIDIMQPDQHARFGNYRGISLHQLKQKMQNETCISKEDLITSQAYYGEILRYLISLTWRDVSLYYRSNIDGTKQDIKIIDYELKPIEKLEVHRQKQRKLLQKLLASKIQNFHL